MICLRKPCTVALLFLALSGCIPASKPTPPENMKQAPQARLVAFQEAAPETTAIVVVTRDTGVVRRPCYLALHINGILAARLAAGETSLFYVQSGRVSLKSTSDPNGKGLCAMFHDEGPALEVAIAEDETKYFRLGTDGHGALRLLENDGRRP